MSLDNWPERRREALLWRYALELDYADVADLVAEHAGGSCHHMLWGEPTVSMEATAVLGDDGRYHLFLDGQPRCSEAATKTDPEQTLRHKQWCHWWTDGTRYLTQVPHSACGPEGRFTGSTNDLTVSWLVTLTDVTVDPATVRAPQRCVHPSTRTVWPGYQGQLTPEGRMRRQLATALGTACHACRTRAGMFIDHDHFTGMVRGLLCQGCNTHVDSCPHLSDCTWADYLNDPPAASLRLRYPKPERTGRSLKTRTKIEYLGFDPLYRGEADWLRRFPPRSPPPPAHTDPIDMSTSQQDSLF